MAKKKPVKKVKKRTTKKKISVKKLKSENYFYVIDGSIIKSLRELADALDQISDDTFYYHVTDTGNDFCNWVKDVLKEMELAEKLLEAGTREKHQIEVLKFLVKK